MSSGPVVAGGVASPLDAGAPLPLEPAGLSRNCTRPPGIDHARVSAWFNAASVDKPGAANRVFEILRAMLASARQWGDQGEHVPDACANIVRNPRRPVARYLDHAELERLGAVLDRRREEHPWPVAAIRLLTLTGARLPEILNLKWYKIGEFGEATSAASARIEDSKIGPRTIWLGPEAVSFLDALPRSEGRDRVFPEDLTSTRLYTVWVRVRDEAGLPGLRIHDCRHTWASQGVMNGVGLTTVGRLLGHRQCGSMPISTMAPCEMPPPSSCVSWDTGRKRPPLPDEPEQLNTSAAGLCCKLGEGAMRDQGASCSPYDSALARRSCSHAMASVRAHGPRPKARSTIRASPTMPPWRANIPAWPLRSARITSKPLIVA